MDFGKCIKFHLKFKVHDALDFMFKIFIELDEFALYLIVHVCVPSFINYNDQSSCPKLIITSSCLST